VRSARGKGQRCGVQQCCLQHSAKGRTECRPFAKKIARMAYLTRAEALVSRKRLDLFECCRGAADRVHFLSAGG